MKTRMAALIGIVFMLIATTVFAADVFQYSAWTGAYTRFKSLLHGSTAYLAPVVYPVDYEWATMYFSTTASNNGSSGTFIGIDLSDTVAYPHKNTDHILLKDIIGSVCLDANTGEWMMRLGVVESQDGGTSGTVAWFWSRMFKRNECSQMTFRPFPIVYDLSLDGDTLEHIVTGIREVLSSLGDDDLIYTLNFDAVYPAPGDMLFSFVELVDGAKIKLSAQLIYQTE